MGRVNDRTRIAWLYRRVGFGLRPGQLDGLAADGVDAALDGLVDPPADAPRNPDPCAGVDLSGYDPKGGNGRKLAAAAIGAWLGAMVDAPRPLEEWIRWFWHGHFVSTLRVVKDPLLMARQLRLLGDEGLGDFRSLLRAVTIDPAMLVYLDGTTNRRGAVNENYGREVLELFALGLGAYEEADVRAGAQALTGWVTARRATSSDPTASFQARRHDDTPQRYLGRDGVHDLDTVIDAIVGHPACAPFVTGRLAAAILGPGVDADLLRGLSADFAASGLQVRPLVRALLAAGVHDGAAQPLVRAPVPWTVAMVKATGAPVGRTITAVAERGLVPSGQVPMDAPNVAGWPGGAAWLSSSATVARFDTAAGIAALAPAEGAVAGAARSGDLAALADGLGLPDGFGPTTTSALRSLAGSDPGGTSVLTVAMASPDLVQA